MRTHEITPLWAVGVVTCLVLLIGGLALIEWEVPTFGMGCLPSESEELASACAAEALSLAELPDEVNISGGTFPVRDQGAQNSCVGFAISTAAGSQSGVIPLSPAFIYNQRTTANCKADRGMSLANGFAILRTSGDCLEELQPYDSGETCAQPSEAARLDAELRRIEAQLLWAGAGTCRVDQIQMQLARGNPVVIAVPIYEDFLLQAKGIIQPHVAGRRFLGGHALVLIGYDQAGGYFLAQNSWGTDWGHNGVGHLSFAMVAQEGWEGWVIPRNLSASPYRAWVHGRCLQRVNGQPLLGVRVSLGDSVPSTTNDKGYWGFYGVLTPGQSTPLQVAAPAGFRLETFVSFIAPSARGDVAVPDIWLLPAGTPTPTPTYAEPTVDPSIMPPTPATATPIPTRRWLMDLEGSLDGELLFRGRVDHITITIIQ